MKKSLRAWCVDHKKEIMITGIVIGAATGGILFIKNWDSILEILNSKTNLVSSKKTEEILSENSEVTVTELPVSKITDIREHVRNLPEGQHHSAIKYEQALKQGIILSKNQTFVSAHPRCYAA